MIFSEHLWFDMQLLCEAVIFCRMEERGSVTERLGWSATDKWEVIRASILRSSLKCSDAIFADQQTRRRSYIVLLTGGTEMKVQWFKVRSKTDLEPA